MRGINQILIIGNCFEHSVRRQNPCDCSFQTNQPNMTATSRQTKPNRLPQQTNPTLTRVTTYLFPSTH